MAEQHLILRVAGDLLRSSEARRVLDREGVAALYDEAVRISGGEGSIPSNQTTTRFADRLIASGLLSRVQRDLYANRAIEPAVQPNELTPKLRDGAVVGLYTVLGEIGIAHNPSRVVTALMPASSRSIGLKRRVETPVGDFRFIGISEEIFFAGSEADRLDPIFSYPRATPERAFCDWIYLAAQRGPGKIASPPLDLAAEELDQDRVGRLADAMGVRGYVEAWMAQRAIFLEDEEAAEKFSQKLGF